MKSIDIDISPDGTVKIEAIGYKGNACEAATKEIEAILGGQIKSKVRKPEFYQTVAATQKVTL